jgi:type I restriction enzyme S subunit
MKNKTESSLQNNSSNHIVILNQSVSQLPPHWLMTTIGEVGIVTSGGTPSTRNQSFWEGEISWITPADLSKYTKKFISHGSRNISQEGLNNSSTKLLPKGTVLFSSRAPIGYTVIA